MTDIEALFSMLDYRDELIEAVNKAREEGKPEEAESLLFQVELLDSVLDDSIAMLKLPGIIGWAYHLIFG